MISLDEDVYVYANDKHMISHKKGLKKSTSGFVQNVSQKCKVLLMCVFFIEMYVSFGVKHYFLRQNWLHVDNAFLASHKKILWNQVPGLLKIRKNRDFFLIVFFLLFVLSFKVDVDFSSKNVT